MKKVVALLVPVTSRRRSDKSVLESPLINILLPSLLSSITQADVELFTYRIYIGYDAGDALYDSKESEEQLFDVLKQSLQREKMLDDAATCLVTLECVRCENTQHSPAHVWNHLFRKAYDQNSDYFYQIGDDCRIVDANWTQTFVGTLARQNDVGVTGPKDFGLWNHTDFMTQSFVSRKHMQIFDYFFPWEITNWSCDTWINEVYSPTHKIIQTQHRVENTPPPKNAPKTRYTVKRIDRASLDNMVNSGKEKIAAFLRRSNANWQTKEAVDNRDRGCTWLEKTHMILRRLLLVLHDICEKNDIEYFLMYGTLLGAWRSAQNIQWDGDIDLGMTEDNYERFCQIVDAQLPDDVYFQTKKKEPALTSHYLSKLRDRYSSYAEHKANSPYVNVVWQSGVQLDIFVFRKIEQAGGDVCWRDMFVYSKNFEITNEQLYPLQLVQFEGYNVWAPNQIEDILRKQYGYLYLPPKSSRITHEERVTPYQSDSHKESRQWYKGKVYVELQDAKNVSDLLRCVAAALSYAVRTRRNVVLIDNNVAVLFWKHHLLPMLATSKWDTSPTSVVLPPISICRLFSAKNASIHDSNSAGSFEEIPEFPNVENVLLRGAKYQNENYYRNMAKSLALLYPKNEFVDLRQSFDENLCAFLESGERSTTTSNTQRVFLESALYGTKDSAQLKDVKALVVEHLFVTEISTIVIPALTDLDKLFCAPVGERKMMLHLKLVEKQTKTVEEIFVSSWPDQTLRIVCSVE